MGSQFWFEAQRKSQHHNPEGEVSHGVTDRLRKLKPNYSVSYAASVPRLSILGKDARFRKGVSEAMHFYSESQMR